MAPPSTKIATSDVTAINQTGGISGTEEVVSSTAMPAAVATAAAIPLIQDVDHAEYIEVPA
jgi:hypothetical protein